MLNERRVKSSIGGHTKQKKESRKEKMKKFISTVGFALEIAMVMVIAYLLMRIKQELGVPVLP